MAKKKDVILRLRNLSSLMAETARAMERISDLDDPRDDREFKSRALELRGAGTIAAIWADKLEQLP